MITVVSGTNRKNSEALRYARLLEGFYRQKGQAVQVLALENMPHDYFFAEMYENSEALPEFLKEIQDEFLVAPTKFHFVLPEYNGGMPGALKLFIDAVSVRNIKATFHGKKAALLGISAGHTGNARGMDHFTSVLHHLNVTVMPLQQPVSAIRKLVDEQGSLSDPDTLRRIERQVDAFIAF